MTIKPGHVYLGNNEWATQEYYQQLVANGQIEHLGGDSKSVTHYGFDSQSPKANHAGQVTPLPLPTTNTEATRDARYVGNHLPLPTMV